MALDASKLNDGFVDLAANPPASKADAASAWADLIADYAGDVVPASVGVTAATPALAAGLLSAFGAVDPASTGAAMESALLTFATAAGAGMTAAGFTGTPPPAPVGFIALLGTPQASKESWAAAWSTSLDTWFKTGGAVLIAPPFTVSTWT